MRRLLANWKNLNDAGLLGLNARNADYIMRCNPRRNYPLVDDKVRCKQVLQAHGMPTPELIGVITKRHQGRSGSTSATHRPRRRSAPASKHIDLAPGALVTCAEEGTK